MLTLNFEFGSRFPLSMSRMKKYSDREEDNRICVNCGLSDVDSPLKDDGEQDSSSDYT